MLNSCLFKYCFGACPPIASLMLKPTMPASHDDNSDYKKTVDKQSRGKITLKNQYSRFVKTRIIGISLNSRI